MCGKIAGYKSQLLANLRGKAEKILEIGIGTGPNLKYYADFPGIHVFGVDPNRKMEKYAQAAAETAGLPPSNFRFMQAVCIYSTCPNCANIFNFHYICVIFFKCRLFEEINISILSVDA